jgi:hypothetical protein
MRALPKRLLGAAIQIALAVSMAGAPPAAAQDAAKPNILLIVGDDVGYGDLGPISAELTGGCRPPISISSRQKG